MRKLLITLLIVLLTVTLCVNFVRFTFYTSAGSEGDFILLDLFVILDIFDDFNLSTDLLFKDLLESLEALGSAGEAFSRVVTVHTFTYDFFSAVVGQFNALIDMFSGIVTFFVSIAKASVSLVTWSVDLLRMIYRMLNALLGTSFGT